MGELKPTTTSILEPGQQSGFATTKFESLLAWAQKYSLFMNPFVTACCGMEFMAVSSPRYDFSRLGSEARASRRAADVLWVWARSCQRTRRCEAYLRAMAEQVGAGVRHAPRARLLRQLPCAPHRQDHPAT